MMRMHGPVFFASVDAIEASLRRMDAEHPEQKTVILELKGTEKIDMAGADFLIAEIRRARKRGGDFHIIATYHGILRQLIRLGVVRVLGRDHLHANKTAAIARAVPELRDDICRGCSLRIFHECAQRPGSLAEDDGHARTV